MCLKNSRQGSASKKNDRSTSAKGKGSKGSAKSSRIGSAKSAKSSKSKKTEEPKEVESIPKPGDKGINNFISFEKFLLICNGGASKLVKFKLLIFRLRMI